MRERIEDRLELLVYSRPQYGEWNYFHRGGNGAINPQATAAPNRRVTAFVGSFAPSKNPFAFLADDFVQRTKSSTNDRN